jgi:hypothetical protein
VPRSAFVAFEIPAGQKLYLRNVRVTPHPVSSFPWPLILATGTVLVALLIVVAAWAIRRKRRAPTQSNVQQEKGTL